MPSTDSSPYPPLLGDGQGKFRVHILGNSGSGKSTMAAQLARILGIPLISLDRIHWQPGWKSTPGEEFRQALRAALEEANGSWVVEGDYVGSIGNIVLDASTDVIWLDPPLLLYFSRIVLRTFRRLFGWEEPCSQGCNEEYQEAFFSRKSILWWCLTHHVPSRRRNQERMSKIGLGVGSDHFNLRMRRLGGWGYERDAWIQRVQNMIDSRKSD